MTWIDYVIIAVLAVAVLGIIGYLVKEKRQGKSGCGCGCNGCPHANACANARAEKPLEMSEKESTNPENEIL